MNILSNAPLKSKRSNVDISNLSKLVFRKICCMYCCCKVKCFVKQILKLTCFMRLEGADVNWILKQ